MIPQSLDLAHSLACSVDERESECEMKIRRYHFSRSSAVNPGILHLKPHMHAEPKRVEDYGSLALR